MDQAGSAKSGSVRLDIITAAAREFAKKPYSLVNLDDILAHADVKKSAMYAHFRSKHALATAIIEHRALLARSTFDDLKTPSSPALETLIAATYSIAVADISDDLARAGLNLLESVGRFDGFQSTLVEAWIAGFARLTRLAIEEGDVLETSDPSAVGRTVVSMYLGLRQTSRPDEPKTFIGDLESAWLLTLPGFANPRRMDYLSGFIRRRSALAIRNTAPPGDGNL
jgi:TetR/AcrR family transcriptional regulator, transcriptional repressor for nem operon